MKQEESIAATVKRASEIPDDDGQGGANVTIPQLFAQYPIPQGEPVISDLPAPDARSIQGIPQWNFRAHFKRFVMGQTVTGRDGDGNYIYEERDDSVDYENLMNSILEGEAIIRWEERKTLTDGTMVISVSYLTPKPKAKKDDAS